jgi:hypothetical protein
MMGLAVAQRIVQYKLEPSVARKASDGGSRNPGYLLRAGHKTGRLRSGRMVQAIERINEKTCNRWCVLIATSGGKAKGKLIRGGQCEP